MRERDEKEEKICFNLSAECLTGCNSSQKRIRNFKQSRLLVFLFLFVAFFFPLSTDLIHCLIAIQIPSKKEKVQDPFISHNLNV